MEETTVSDKGLWRDLIAYWILGLCNNYGYVVMLTAAHDILSKFEIEDNAIESKTQMRECNIVSSGGILLADILPSLVIKLFGPFLTFHIQFRVLLACLFQMFGFLLVGFAYYEWMAVLGVILTSFSAGLGETTLVSYSVLFNKNVISTWSSGTGGAGLIGSISYASLISLGVDEAVTILIMLIIPIFEIITFWIILRKPIDRNGQDDNIHCVDCDMDTTSFENLSEKFKYIPKLLKYMIPLTLVMLFQYFINQGLIELIYFENISLDQDTQYRWAQVIYQIGVFISRSSVNIIRIHKLWILAVLQFGNVTFMLLEVVYFFSPSLYLVFAVILWEGLIGGTAYVNGFYRINTEIPFGKRQFAMGVAALCNSFGIALSAIFAIPIHNKICSSPLPNRGR